MRDRVQAIAIQAPQRSDEWYQARLGKVTGSKVACVLDYSTPTAKMIDQATLVFGEKKMSPEELETLVRLREEYPIEYVLRAGIELTEKATRLNYRRALVGERLSGVQADPEQYVNYDMKWGIANEPVAINKYMLETGNIVNPAYLKVHPKLRTGASSDGDVVNAKTGEVGVIECKCLKTANHLYKVMKDEQLPPEYIPQIQHEQWINNVDYCDFIGFDSRLPEGLQIMILRIERDDFYIEEVLKPGIVRFLDECDNDFKAFWARITDRQKAKELQNA